MMWDVTPVFLCPSALAIFHAIFPLIFISDIKSLQNKSSLIYAEPCMSAFLTASRTETAYAVLGFLFNDRVRLLQ